MAASVQRKFVLLLCLFIFHSIPVAADSIFVYNVEDDDFEGDVSLNFVSVEDEHMISKRQISSGQQDVLAVPTKLPPSNSGKSVVSMKAAAPSPSKSSVVQPLKSSINSTEEQLDTDEYSDVDFTTVSPLVKKYDYHFYYNSSFNIEVEKWKEYWINLEPLKKTVTVHDLLSTSYRRAIMVTLSFDFPFYGHMLRNLTIATGGFIFTGEHVHSWLAATQYIAPLMANFDPSLHNESMVKYLDNGTAFTVQWENVHLQDKIEAGNFTFQVTLLNNGDIIFVYKTVPIMVTTINDMKHPVKVGISDAYIIDRTIFFLRRKTIYEYHRIDLASQQIGSTTSIYFTALPTCIGLPNCSSCLTAKIGFDCVWCGGHCSDGMDRHRQNWIQDGCEQVEGTHCPGDEATNGNTSETDEVTQGNMNKTETATPFLLTNPPSISVLSTAASDGNPDALSAVKYSGDVDHVSLGTAGIVGILFVVAMTVGFMAWLGYAYKNPHSSSGQLLIRYRPSQWNWPKTEARYTAASVHM